MYEIDFKAPRLSRSSALNRIYGFLNLEYTGRCCIYNYTAQTGGENNGGRSEKEKLREDRAGKGHGLTVEQGSAGWLSDGRRGEVS